jgi:hypothetical protein
MSTKQTPKSCSCGQCKRGKGTKYGKIRMKQDERSFRHKMKQNLKMSKGEYYAAPIGNYFD